MKNYLTGKCEMSIFSVWNRASLGLANQQVVGPWKCVVKILIIVWRQISDSCPKLCIQFPMYDSLIKTSKHYSDSKINVIQPIIIIQFTFQYIREKINWIECGADARLKTCQSSDNEWWENLIKFSSPKIMIHR